MDIDSKTAEADKRHADMYAEKMPRDYGPFTTDYDDGTYCTTVTTDDHRLVPGAESWGLLEYITDLVAESTGLAASDIIVTRYDKAKYQRADSFETNYNVMWKRKALPKPKLALASRLRALIEKLSEIEQEVAGVDYMNPARVIGWLAVAEKAMGLWRKWRKRRADRKAYKDTLKRYSLLLPFTALLICGCEEPWDGESHLSEEERQIIAAEIHPGTIVLGDRTTVGGNVDSLNQSIITGEDVEIGGNVNSGPPKEQQ